MNKQIPLDPITNVVNNGIAIADLNKLLGTVLEKLTFTLGGTFTRAMITNFVLKANSKIIFETDGARLESTNIYNGGVTDVTLLKVDFMDRKAVTVNARQAGAIDLSRESGITTLRAEITIAGATSPTLIGFADVSPVTADPAEQGIRFLMTRRHRNTQVIGGSGEYALQVPHIDPVGGGSNFRRIFIFSANCTAIKSVRDGVVEHELLKLQNEAAQKDNSKFPQANLVVFDPVQDGQISRRTWDTRPSSGVQSSQFYGRFSAGETITIETEELIGFDAY